MNLLQPGQVIFNYIEIIDFQRGDGQSFTYLAENKHPNANPWDKKLFVKQYNDLMKGTPEFKIIAQHYNLMEERLADKANYLCLPQWVGEIDGSIVAVFPFLEGKSLQAWSQEGMTQDQCIRFAFGITTAIQALHRAGIAHLDIKPENIIINQNQRSGKYFVHLIDIDAATLDGKGLRSSVYGSPGYMSPEHISEFRRKFLGQPSDIFALGIILCELLFKKYPYDNFGVPDEILTHRVVLPDGVVEPRLKIAIEQCFELDTRKRPTAGRLLRLLNATDLQEGSNQAEEQADGLQFPLGGARSEEATSGGRVINRVRMYQDGGFERNYYVDTELTARNFRGSSLSTEDRRFSEIRMYLRFMSDGVYLENHSTAMTVKLGVTNNLDPLVHSQRARIERNVILEIAGDESTPLAMPHLFKFEAFE